NFPQAGSPLTNESGTRHCVLLNDDRGRYGAWRAGGSFQGNLRPVTSSERFSCFIHARTRRHTPARVGSRDRVFSTVLTGVLKWLQEPFWVAFSGWAGRSLSLPRRVGLR